MTDPTVVVAGQRGPPALDHHFPAPSWGTDVCADPEMRVETQCQFNE